MKLEVNGVAVEYDGSLTYLDISKTGRIVELDLEQLKNILFLGERLDTKLQIFFSSLVIEETFSIDSYTDQKKEKIDEEKRQGLRNTISLYKRIFRAIGYEVRESKLHEEVYQRKN